MKLNWLLMEMGSNEMVIIYLNECLRLSKERDLPNRGKLQNSVMFTLFMHFITLAHNL